MHENRNGFNIRKEDSLLYFSGLACIPNQYHSYSGDYIKLLTKMFLYECNYKRVHGYHKCSLLII